MRTRKSPEVRLEEKEAQLLKLKRNLRMASVPGVKEAVFLARALRKWDEEFGGLADDEEGILASAADILDVCAEEPSQ